jgi:predicted 3-demethylubiquinone-9 3-methyltransferase (glyoxalase superfamily)
MAHVSVCLWFSDDAEQAVSHYVSVLTEVGIGATVLQMSRYNEESAKKSGRPVGSVMTVVFELAGQQFMALNGGPMFTFNPSASIVVNCDTQQQIDLLWDRLIANGGREVQCGWLTDKYGLSWQIVPVKLGEWMQDPQRAGRVMARLLGMKKLDIAALESA